MNRAILPLCLAIWLVSCKAGKTVYVPVESSKIEYKDRIIRDSIYQKDSIFFAIKGDTVYFEKYKLVYQDRYFRDSIFIQDTIRVPYPVDKIVEVNRLRWYQETLMWLGVGTLVILMLWLIKRKI